MAKTKITSIDKSKITLGIESGTNRTLYASWDYTNTSNRAKEFKTLWTYATGDGEWFTGAEDTVALPVSGIHSNCTYSAPENALKVRFRVKPVPRDEDNYTSSYSGSLTYDFTVSNGAVKQIAKSKIGISIKNGTDRTLLAQWTYPRDDGETGKFVVQWWYKSNTWICESSEDGDDVAYAFRYSEYTPPEATITNEVRFRIKPIAEFEEDFDSTWSEFVNFKFGADVEDRKIETSNITIGFDNVLEGSLYATWSNYSVSDGHTDHFEVEWDYSNGHGWISGSSESIGSAYHTCLYSPEEGNLKVRFRVMPVPVLSTYFNGVWSDYVIFNLTAAKGATAQIRAENIEISIENGGGARSMIARWNGWHQEDPRSNYDISDGRTSGFECVWQYTTGNGFWFDGNTETVAYDRIYSTYTAPDNALSVKFKIRPIPTNDSYFIGKWSADIKYVFSSTTGSKAKMGGVVLGMQSGTDRTIFASWAEGTNLATVRETSSGSMVSGNGMGTAISTASGEARIIKEEAGNQYLALCQPLRPNIFLAGDKVEYSLYIKASTTERDVSIRVYAYDSSNNTIGSNTKTFHITTSLKKYSGSINISNVSTWTKTWNDAAYYTILIRDTQVNGVYEQLSIKQASAIRVPASYTISDGNTDHFEIKWMYATGDGVWFTGSESTVDADKTNTTYSAPSNALKVRFHIRPVSKTYTANGMESTYFVGIWTSVTYSFTSDVSVETPSVPSVTIDGNTLTAEVDCYDANTNLIRFYIIRDNDDSSGVKSGYASVITNRAAFTCTVALGHYYKVKCRAYNTKEKISSENVSTIASYEAMSDWSEYSENVGTIPARPSLTSSEVRSSTEVLLNFKTSVTAESYEVQYTTDEIYFDSSSSEVNSVTIEATGSSETSYVIISGMETGVRWYFRLRASNDNGESAWSNVISRILGTRPTAPTTWNDKFTVRTTERIILYWSHNSEDGSAQSDAEIELRLNDASSTNPTQTVTNLLTASSYVIEIQSLSDSSPLAPIKSGGTLYWKVKTKGITASFSPFSVQRSVDVIDSPSIVGLNINTNDTSNGKQKFPLIFSARVDPLTQRMSGYRLVLVKKTANYDTDSLGERVIRSVADITGNLRQINVDQTVYDKYFTVDQNDETNRISITVSAADFFPENSIEYEYRLTVYMRSGLSVTSQPGRFTLALEDVDFEVNANVTVLPNKAAAVIRPYCRKISDNTLISTAVLYVYRREFDGSLTLIQGNYPNTDDRTQYIVDPHPALDYARYRIVAQIPRTGEVDFVDLPGVPMGIKSIVIKWDEEWDNYETDSEDALEQMPIQGSMITLPYNIDISDNYAKDVSLVEYIGRSNPVSYYGTQTGESSEWSADISAKESELLYRLRKLAVYPGDVFVREPSGSGYWANVTVTFSKSHSATTIPVKISVKRVEGGK